MPDDPTGYIYTPGLEVTTPGDVVLVEDKAAPSIKGERIVVYADAEPELLTATVALFSVMMILTGLSRYPYWIGREHDGVAFLRSDSIFAVGPPERWGKVFGVWSGEEKYGVLERRAAV
jgi:hypothetical protein